MVSIFNVLEKKKNPVFYFCLSSLPLTPLEPLVMAGGIKLVPCFLPVASPLEVKVSTLDRICGGYKVVAVKFSGWGLQCICARTFRPACDDSSWVYFLQNGEIWSEMLCCRLNESWDWRPETEKGNRLLSVLFLLLYIFFFSSVLRREFIEDCIRSLDHSVLWPECSILAGRACRGTVT